MAKPPLERVARALCSHHNIPENIKYEGRPMWEQYLPQARLVIEAIREPDKSISADHQEAWRKAIDAILNL